MLRDRSDVTALLGKSRSAIRRSQGVIAQAACRDGCLSPVEGSSNGQGHAPDRHRPRRDLGSLRPGAEHPRDPPAGRRSYWTVENVFRSSGGIRPQLRTRSKRALTLEEREEISLGVRAKESFATSAERIDRSTSTVSREVARNGGRSAYRATRADKAALERLRRPKVPKLAQLDNVKVGGGRGGEVGASMVAAADLEVVEDRIPG